MELERDPLDVEELRARLEEAEELLRAIRLGEVDALLVEGPEGERVYTLSGADRPYREFVDSMSEGAVTVAADGTVLYCNAAFGRLVGAPLEQITGAPLDTHFEGGLPGSPDAPGGSAEIRAAGGRRVPVAISSRPVTFDGNRFTAVIVTDLSGQRLQQRLADSEARFRALFEQSPLPIQVFDREGFLRRVNPAFERAFGEAEGRRGHNLLADPRVDRSGSREVFERIFAGETASTPPLRYESPEGVVAEPARWFELTGFPVRSATGEMVEVVLVVQEVTARVAAERKMRAAEREAARQKDDFIAILAHELRNPLAPIRTSVGILRARGTVDPVLTRCHDVIERQLAHMARLLDDLLDVSRISRGELTLERQRVELPSVIEAALELSLPVVEQYNHELVVEGLDQPLPLEADPARLTQVFGNLLNNAAKYSDPGGHIRVAVAREGAEAVVRVRDHGVGLDPGMIDRIFELFAQADDARQGRQGGLGIGLSLARRLVELHGGRIEVASDGPGRGCEFTVRLPLPPAAP